MQTHDGGVILFYNYTAELMDCRIQMFFRVFDHYSSCPFSLPQRSRKLFWFRMGMFNLQVWVLWPYCYSLKENVPFCWTTFAIIYGPKSSRKCSPSRVSPHLISAFIFHFQSFILCYQRVSEEEFTWKSFAQLFLLISYFKLCFYWILIFFTLIFPVGNLNESNSVIANLAKGE